MVENIKVSVNILPFGHMRLTINSRKEKFEEKEIPIYVEPQLTNIEKIEISYEESLKEYKVSETTDGR
ncbi:MAG: hypothetical protein DRN40_04140 [Thermoplasmata archaeon]|nr:MAG: hypothetical protein DRN40_04140 [Thermoplasmata archaeon]